MDNLLDDYFSLALKIHEAFGYVEDWKIIPMQDFRTVKWYLHLDKPRNPDEPERCGGSLWYWVDDPALANETGYELNAAYQASIYTQRFLPKWVYATPTHTLVSMDPQVDGNTYLGIFVNSNKVDKSQLPDFITDELF